MSIIELITDVALQQGCKVVNDGGDLTITTENPCKLISMIVCTAFERQGLDIGQIVASAMVEADFDNYTLHIYTISLEITQTRLMTFDEIRTYQATIGA